MTIDSTSPFARTTIRASGSKGAYIDSHEDSLPCVLVLQGLGWTPTMTCTIIATMTITMNSKLEKKYQKTKQLTATNYNNNKNKLKLQ